MTEKQKKKIEEIINSWNGDMDADFHGMLMSMAKVLGRDKDITEENYREIMDEALLEIAKGYGYNEAEISQSEKEISNMLNDGTIKIPPEYDFDTEFKDYLSGLRKIFK